MSALEAIDRAHVEAVEHAGRGVGVAHPALLTLATKGVANDARDAERLGPQPQARQVDPPQPADEDRVRVRIRERDGERRAGRGSGFLVLLLHRREDTLPAISRVRGHVHRDREARLDAFESRVEEAHRGDAHDLSLVDGERDDPLAAGVPVEPPGELLVGELRRADTGEQRNERRSPLGRVADDLEAQRVAVPSTLLNARRA